MYTGQDVIQEVAYLYSMWNGRLVVYQGKVLGSFLNGQGRFRSSKKAHQCSLYEGELFNSVVWFKEREDQKAKEVLISYEKRMIRNAEIKIIRHQETIKILETTAIIVY